MADPTAIAHKAMPSKKGLLTCALLAGGMLMASHLPALADASKAKETPIQTASLTAGSAGIFPAGAGDEARLCQKAIRGAEKMMGIPDHLLLAVALTESGKLVKDRQKIQEKGKLLSAWPWTVMAESRGRYLPNQQAAIAEVKALQGRGIRNIDVGCMQINLGYHGHAFSNLNEAFDPTNNVAYAAAFLTRLRKERHSWTNAVGYYHSSTPERMRYYKNKVLTLWTQLQQVAIREKSRAVAAGASAELASTGGRSIWTTRTYRDQLKMQTLARTRALRPSTQP